MKEDLAGKDAEFVVTAKSIEAPGTVTIDDEFAKALGLESLEKLRDAVKDRITREHASMSRQKIKRALLDELDKMHKFDPPPTLVEEEFDRVWKSVLQELENERKTFADENTTEEKAKAEYRAIAERRVRLGLVLAEIGEKNNITVTEDELSRAVMGDRVEAEAMARSVVTEFENYVKLNKKVSPEVVGVIQQIEDYAKLADTVASHLAVKIPDKQDVLETASVTQRLEKVLGLMESEISVLQVEKRIRTRVKRQMEKTQREYYLNEQMKAIQKELGDEEGRDELQELEDKIKKTKLSKEAREKATHELKKLRQMSPMSAEATVVRNYLDWLLSIPWNKKSKVKKDLNLAEQILDADHYGLEKVKERIVEYLAVQQRANKLTGPILCLVGPPGVGKTSLGKSIAKATGREFVRVSLGGVRDEAEIRGHRRTYIGSMPGKIIQSMRKAKSSNPLFLLDEVDKMGADFRGDPSSALLEVLDPEQNHTFNDHYLEVDYDLSSVMMVAAHSNDLAAAAACGLRTGHTARPNEYGPDTGERSPAVKVDVVAKDLADLAEKLGV